MITSLHKIINIGQNYLVIAFFCHGISDVGLSFLCANRKEVTMFEHICQFSEGFKVKTLIKQEDIIF